MEEEAGERSLALKLNKSQKSSTSAAGVKILNSCNKNSKIRPEGVTTLQENEQQTRSANDK